jgi:hypothetical protein
MKLQFRADESSRRDQSGRVGRASNQKDECWFRLRASGIAAVQQKATAQQQDASVPSSATQRSLKKAQNTVKASFIRKHGQDERDHSFHDATGLHP